MLYKRSCPTFASLTTTTRVTGATKPVLIRGTANSHMTTVASDLSSFSGLPLPPRVVSTTWSIFAVLSTHLVSASLLLETTCRTLSASCLHSCYPLLHDSGCVTPNRRSPLFQVGG